MSDLNEFVLIEFFTKKKRRMLNAGVIILFI